MADKKTSANSFGSFLESVKQAPAEGAQTHGIAKEVLVYLFKKAAPVPVVELMSEMHTSVSSTAAVLDSLSATDLVRIARVANQEVVELTDIGKMAASR
jgi:DNA-binding MarR family transcriptional regulator